MALIHRDNKRSYMGVTTLLAFTFWTGGALSAFAQSLAEPMRTVVPVHLDASTGDIKVGNTTYPGASNSMHLLALRRQPNRNHLDAPDVIDNGTFTTKDSANTFLQNVGKTDAVLIVNAVGNYGFNLSDVGANLKSFGAPDLTGQPTVAYVLIGNGGLKTAAQRGYSNQNVDGYLAQDTNGNYTFIQTDYIRYDMDTKGNITVGNTLYTAAAAPGKQSNCDAAGSNSFHMVIVDRVTPNTRYYDNVYCTAQNPGDFNTMATALSTFIPDTSRLVFITTNGKPIPGDWNFGTDGDARVVNLAKQMARLGGYYETIVYMGLDDTYSLVGAPAPTAGTQGIGKAKESSSVYPDSPNAGLHGVLAHDKYGMGYSPLNADPSGLANLDLYGVLAQSSAPFPNPATSDELAAFQHIAQKLCKSTTCNIRNQYADTNISMDIYFSELENMRTPDNKDCDDDTNAGLPFCIMRQQLLNEIQYVSDIRAFHDNLKSLWLASGTTSILSMLSAYNDIQATLNAPAAAPAPNLVDPIVGFFLGLAGFLPEVGPLFGLADTAFSLATSLTTDTNGNPTVSLQSTVGQLQQQAIQQFESQGTTTATQFDLIYQDWAKMQLLGTALAGAQPGDTWYWDDESTGQILQAMAPAISAAYYRNLMPAVYAIGSYVPGCGDAFDNGCRDNYWGSTPVYAQPIGYIAYANSNTGCCHPFNLIPGNHAAYGPYTYPGDPNNPYQNDPNNPAYIQGHNTILADGKWLGIALQTDQWSANSAGWYDPPQESVLSNLFTPRSQGGLGVYRPAFYEGWPFPRVECAASGNYPYKGAGCDWGAATPSAETHGFGLTNVKIRVGGTVQKIGSTINVTMKVTNNGTVVAKGVEINNISLRALGGSGQAVLMGPVLPIRIGELAPAKSATVVLQIGVTPDLTKLSMTAEGSIDSGGPEPTRFSQAQVIFPQRVQ